MRQNVCYKNIQIAVSSKQQNTQSAYRINKSYNKKETNSYESYQLRCPNVQAGAT